MDKFIMLLPGFVGGALVIMALLYVWASLDRALAEARATRIVKIDNLRYEALRKACADNLLVILNDEPYGRILVALKVQWPANKKDVTVDGVSKAIAKFIVEDKVKSVYIHRRGVSDFMLLFTS